MTNLNKEDVTTLIANNIEKRKTKLVSFNLKEIRNELTKFISVNALGSTSTVRKGRIEPKVISSAKPDTNINNNNENNLNFQLKLIKLHTLDIVFCWSINFVSLK